jgi:hypothetical protein
VATCGNHVKCFKCGQDGHVQRECLKCFHCGRFGHVRLNCPEHPLKTTRTAISKCKILNAATSEELRKWQRIHEQ